MDAILLTSALRIQVLFLHATVAGLGWAFANLLFWGILRGETGPKAFEKIFAEGERVSFALLLITGSLLVFNDPAVLGDPAFRMKLAGISLILISYISVLAHRPSLPAGVTWGAWQALLFIGLLNPSFPLPVFLAAFGLFLLFGLVVERTFRHAV
jgi:hypothetical protein